MVLGIGLFLDLCRPTAFNSVYHTELLTVLKSQGLISFSLGPTQLDRNSLNNQIMAAAESFRLATGVTQISNEANKSVYFNKPKPL